MINQLAQIDFGALESASGNAFSSKSLGDIISKALPYIFAFGGVLLFIYLIAGGFSYMTSAGDPKKTSAAQSQITNALIGVILLLLAFILVQAIGRILGLPSFKEIFGAIEGGLPFC